MEFSLNTSVEHLPHLNMTVSLELNPTVLQTYSTYLYLMIILGVCGNALVLTVFIKHPPNTTTDWFILFITICDFIASFINVPIYASFTNGLWKYFGSDTLCKVHMFISQSLVLSSAFLICALAIDRYIKVCRPMTSFSNVGARNVCVLISILTTLLSIPCFAMFENRQGHCNPVVMGIRLFVYYLFVFLIFLFSTGVVVFSYTHVTRTIRNSEKKVASHNILKRLARGKERNFRKFNKVMPCSTSQLKSNITVKHNKTERANGQLSDDAVTKEVNNIFVLTPKQNMSSSCTPSRDITPSTSYQVTRFMQVSNDEMAETSQTLSINKANRLDVALAEKRSSRKNQTVSLRTTKIAFLVCTVFVVTWIPPWASFILSAILGSERGDIAVAFMLFGRMTYLINNMTNPILYTWLNRKFRRYIIEIFCCRRINI